MKKIFISIVCCLSFTSLIAQDNIGPFESWHNYNVMGIGLEVPNTWSSSDSIVCAFGKSLNPLGTFVKQTFKVSPGNGGSSSAIKVETKDQDAITGVINAGPMPCLATNSLLAVNAAVGFEYSGGLTYIGMPVSASFYVRNNPLLGDSTQVTILAIDDSDGGDSIVAVIDTLLGATISNFTQINMPFKVVNSSFTPTILRVLIGSSGNFVQDTLTSTFTNLHAGSYIEVDDIVITAPTGILNVNKMKVVANVFPTQVSNQLHIHTLIPKTYDFFLSDLKGNIVMSGTYQGKQTVDVSLLSPGTYVYGLKHEKQIVQTGKIVKQ